MPVYVSLINLTEQGARTIKDDPARVGRRPKSLQREGLQTPRRVVDDGAGRRHHDNRSAR